MANLSARHYLTPLFEPAAVAVIGATARPGAVGEVLIANMLAARYRGALFAVNPKYKSVQGIACYASIARVPQRVDLAVIATPEVSSQRNQRIVFAPQAYQPVFADMRLA